jgi:hypothetical protein
VRSSQYEHIRLSRAAELAGESFACEDASSVAKRADATGGWLWWAAALLAILGLATAGLS